MTVEQEQHSTKSAIISSICTFGFTVLLSIVGLVYYNRSNQSDLILGNEMTVINSNYRYWPHNKLATGNGRLIEREPRAVKSVFGEKSFNNWKIKKET